MRLKLQSMSSVKYFKSNQASLNISGPI